MTSSISQFRSELFSRNVARPYLYLAEFTLPKGLQGSNVSSATQSLISLWCHNIQTPQTTMFTDDNFLENGKRRKPIYEYDNQNVNCAFYVDGDYKVKHLFDSWQKLIVGHRRHFNYPDAYTADTLVLNILNLQNSIVYAYTYHKVFPKTINSIDLNYSATGQTASFNVEFAYEKVTFESMTVEQSSVSNVTEVQKTEVQLSNNEEMIQRIGIQLDEQENVIGNFGD